MTTNNRKLDISDEAKNILSEIFKNDAAKKALIDKSIAFVLIVIDKNKIKEYTDEVKKIIEIEKGDGSEFVEAIEILGCIKNILEDLYAHLEEIKAAALSKADRTFVKEHIDIIAQVVIVTALDALEEKNLIDQEILVKILSFVRIAAVLDINMNVSKFFPCCGGSATAE